MSPGSLLAALRAHRILSFVLIALIVVCAVVLGIKDLSKPWTIALQVGTAVLGAALGNFLRDDYSDNVVRNQARPATRHLFDQVRRLQGLVQRAEGYQASMLELDAANMAADSARTSDWFGYLGMSLRQEINATALAIADWNDLVPDVRDAEFESYNSREQRLPGQEGQQST